jgi:hypothetical protein
MQAIVNDVNRRSSMNTLNRLHSFRLRALALPVLIAGLSAGPVATTAAHAADHPATHTPTAAAAVVAQPTQPTTTTQAQDSTVAPVAGLDQTQMDHAKTIVDVANQMHLPKKAAVVAVSTSMQETNLHNLANTGLPDSEHLPNDGTGYDHDSVGLFQQRPASGWGTVNELMDPATSAHKFYQALDQVPGWQDMPVTQAAQTVQGSAFPDAYAQHEPAAQTVVDTLTK